MTSLDQTMSRGTRLAAMPAVVGLVEAIAMQSWMVVVANR